MIRKTVGYHYKGIFVGILLGIVGTILVQNATMPAWLKKTDVPPEPNPSAGIIPYDPPTPNLKSGIMPSDPKIIPTTPMPPNNPPGMPRNYGPDGRNAPPATELPQPTDPPKLPPPTEIKPPTELPGFPNGLPPNYIPPAPPR